MRLMSAYGYKQTFTHTVIYVRFTPGSGHNQAISRMSANDPKRTFGEISGRSDMGREGGVLDQVVTRASATVDHPMRNG